MTASQGIGCAFSAVPVALFQGGCTVAAFFAGSFMDEAMLSNLSYVGNVLTANLYLNSSAVTYQWYMNGSRISGATGHQLTLNSAMTGSSVWVVVTAADSDFTGSVASNSCTVVADDRQPGTTTDIIIMTR